MQLTMASSHEMETFRLRSVIRRVVGVGSSGLTKKHIDNDTVSNQAINLLLEEGD